MHLQMKKTQSLPSGNIYTSRGSRCVCTWSTILQAAHERTPDVGGNRELWLQTRSLFLGIFGETVRQEMTSSQDLGRQNRKDSPESRIIYLKERVRQDLGVDGVWYWSTARRSGSELHLCQLGALLPTTGDLGFLICTWRVWLVICRCLPTLTSHDSTSASRNANTLY